MPDAREHSDRELIRVRFDKYRGLPQGIAFVMGRHVCETRSIAILVQQVSTLRDYIIYMYSSPMNNTVCSIRVCHPHIFQHCLNPPGLTSSRLFCYWWIISLLLESCVSPMGDAPRAMAELHSDYSGHVSLVGNQVELQFEVV